MGGTGQEGGRTAVIKYTEYRNLSTAVCDYPVLSCKVSGEPDLVQALLDTGTTTTIADPHTAAPLVRRGRYLWDTLVQGVKGHSSAPVYDVPGLVVMAGARPLCTIGRFELVVMETGLPFALLGRNVADRLDVCLHGERRELSITVPG